MVKKVIIVDDEPGVIHSVKAGLERLDNEIEVKTFSRGRDLFPFLEEYEKPDVILLDIMMPDMTGWQILEKLRQNTNWKTIPVIFLTARKDYVAKHAGSFLAEDYIEKPFKIPELKEHIDKILN